MIQRTKEITKSQNRLMKDYRFEEPPIRKERDSAADLKAQAHKYEEILRQKKENLKKLRALGSGV